MNNYYSYFIFYFSFVFCVFFIEAHQNIMELSQNIYPIYFPYGTKYDPLVQVNSIGLCSLEWKSSHPFHSKNFLITVRSRSSSVRLESLCGDFLDVELFDGNNFSKPITLFDLQNFFEAALPIELEWNTVVMRYPIGILIPPQQKVRAGNYKCFIEIGIYTIDGKEIETQTIQLIVEVAQFQKISIHGNSLISSDHYFHLDFGEVIRPVTKNFQLQLESNIPYELYIQSLNGGYLLLNPEWTHNHYNCKEIPYDCSLNGKKTSLEKKNQLISITSQQSEITDNRCTFSITILPDIKKNWEGVYEDEITFSIRPMY